LSISQPKFCISQPAVFISQPKFSLSQPMCCISRPTFPFRSPSFGFRNPSFGFRHHLPIENYQGYPCNGRPPNKRTLYMYIYIYIYINLYVSHEFGNQSVAFQTAAAKTSTRCAQPLAFMQPRNVEDVCKL
jgi:hypothetical protein